MTTDQQLIKVVNLKLPTPVDLSSLLGEHQKLQRKTITVQLVLVLVCGCILVSKKLSKPPLVYFWAVCFLPEA